MVPLRLLVVLSLLASLFMVVGAAHAEEVIAGSVYDQDKETDSVLKARRRAYAGGRDEGELVVQTQLPAPIRKMTPQVEAGGDAGGDDSF
jgi:hypothetical protein